MWPPDLFVLGWPALSLMHQGLILALTALTAAPARGGGLTVNGNLTARGGATFQVLSSCK